MSALPVALADILLGYLRAGYQPVPLCAANNGACNWAVHHAKGPCSSPGKRPLIAGYRSFASTTMSDTQMVGVFEAHPLCNIGMVVPEGHVVVEADSPEADSELLTLRGPAPTLERAPRPSRGRALLFRLPPGWQVKNGTHRGASKGIDFIAPGGILVVPPSIHRSGHVYEWIAGRSPEDLAPAELPLAVAQLAPRKTTPSPKLSRPRSKGVAPSLSFLLKADRELSDLWRGQSKGSGDTSESGYDYAVASKLAKAGYAVGEIAEVLAQRPRSHPRDGYYFERTAKSVSGKRGSK